MVLNKVFLFLGNTIDHVDISWCTKYIVIVALGKNEGQ